MTSNPTAALTLLAPMTGMMMPIDTVPDPVFAQKMMGDGIAIDPIESTLVAPCDGVISQFFKTHHALTIRTAQGAEILMHVGLDTVTLQGQGFEPLVKEGDSVTLGQPLIKLDLDFLAQNARSLVTPIILSAANGYVIASPASGLVKAGETPLLQLIAEGQFATQGNMTDFSVMDKAADARLDVLIPNPTGLHARPAARLIQQAKDLGAIVRLQSNGQSARADSVTEIMKLNTKQGDTLTIEAWGAEAQAHVAALATAIEQGLGEDVSGFKPQEMVAPVEIPEEQPLLSIGSADPNHLNGVKAVPGMVVGQLVHIGNQELEITEQGENPATESHKLTTSIERVIVELQSQVAELSAQGKTAQMEIFTAHLQLVNDPALVSPAQSLMQQGKSAAFAWQHAIQQEVSALKALNSPVLSARAADIQDVGQRVLFDLLGIETHLTNLPDQAIMVYKDITPSDLINLDLTKIKGLCSLEGGASSHAAIIARSLDLPYLTGVDAAIRDQADGTQVILNADQGFVQLQPSAADIEYCQTYKQTQEAAYQAALANAHELAITKDGVRVEVAANIGSLKDAKKAIELGAEGVGLLRTEFLYLDRTTAPTEDEQTQIYSDILEVMGQDRPVIIRTLDVGGDKPLPYLPLPAEENPFLGERGIRVGINRPSILRTQLRALLRSAKAGKLKVMLPMIGSLDEFRVVKELLMKEAAEFDVELALGIMVEVPSAAIMARELAKEAAFFSIGTNDLTQYTLAIDRGHPRMASRVDALHPAVLRMIAMTCEGAQAENGWTGVCGGIASDVDAIPILLGLGVNELSVSIPTLPQVKARVRELDMAECQQLAKEALTMADGAQVRELLKRWQEAR